MSRHSNRVRNRKMRLENLETRDVPAIFDVTAFADTVANDGFLSLREAVIASNINPGDDTINLPVGNFFLTITGTNEEAAATGDLDITDTTGTTTIVGKAVFLAALDGGGNDRVFDVQSGAKLTVRNLAVRNGGGLGVGIGGGIQNRGLLTIENSEISFNTAILQGGAIGNNGTNAQIISSGTKYIGNTVGPAVTAGPSGGAVSLAGGTATFTRDIFSGNTANLGFGGAIHARSSTFSVTDTFFGFNKADEGGAVATIGGNAFISGSQFMNNSALKNGNATVPPFSAGSVGGRGGALLAQGEVRVASSTFNQNFAEGTNGQGGAIANTNFLEVVNSTVNNNIAGKSSVANPVSVGGGIANLSGFLRLSNSTVVFNRSLFTSAVAGGVYNSNLVGAVSTVQIQNTIVAQNNVGANGSNAPDISGIFTSTGGNLIGNAVGSSGWIASDQTGNFITPIDPRLGQFGTYGSLAPNFPLLAGSPALDKGVLNGDTPTTDQRGQPRPAGPGVDVGAFEFQPNAVPTAEDDFFFTPEDTPYFAQDVGVFQNDADPNGHALTAVLVSGPAHGTLVFNPANGAFKGSFLYTPNKDFTGSDSFTYRAVNSVGNSATATAYFTVGNANDAPAAKNVTYSTDEDTGVSTPLVAIDSEGDPISFTVATNPANGTLSFDQAGVPFYTPNENFFGTDSFTFTASDGKLASAPATVTINVAPVNDDPQTTDDDYATDEDTPLVVPVATGVLSNDSDIDGDALSAAVDSGPTNGSLALAPDGRFTYTPNANFHGADSFTYSVSDGNGGTAFGTVRIDVRSVNDLPAVLDATAALDEDGSFDGQLFGIDVDGDALTFAAVAGPTNGSLAVNPNGTFKYTPNANFNGTDTFTYRANDGTANGNAATVSITVNPVNDAPVADDQSASTDEDTPLVGAAVANDIDGDVLVYALVGGPTKGSLVFNTATGAFTYTPNANFNGTDSFTFKVNDGTVDSNVATVNIGVAAVNDAPVASDGSASTNEDTPVDGQLVAVDPEGGAPTYSVVAGPTKGTLVLNAATGAYTYTPNPNANGTDSFTFKANDGAADSNVATVSISVAAANDAPTVSPGTVATDEDIAATGTLTAIDVDGDAVTFAVVTGPTNGTLALNPATGAFTYTPNANSNGDDSFTYRANDGSANSNVATVSITVRPVNDAPTLSPATFTLPENSPNGTSVGTVGGADVEGNLLTYSIVGGNTGTAFAIDVATGAIRVATSSALNFETTPVFSLTVRVTDTGGLTGQATVTVRLTDIQESLRVTIDIEPDDRRNRINLNSNADIEVAILSTANFDARTVDVESLRFGRTGQEDSLSRDRRGRPRFEYRDVNGDGRRDLVVRFEIDATGFRSNSTRGYLTGRLANGTAFSADDAVSIERDRGC